MSWIVISAAVLVAIIVIRQRVRTPITQNQKHTVETLPHELSAHQHVVP